MYVLPGFENDNMIWKTVYCINNNLKNITGTDEEESKSMKENEA